MSPALPASLLAAALAATGGLRLDPAELGPYRSCLSLPDDAEATQSCEAALRSGLPAPRAAIALQILGVRFAALGRWDEAVEAYRRWVDLAPEDAGAWRRLGEALFAGTGRTQAALDAFDRACRLDPQDAPAHGFRALVLNALGRHADAVRAFEDALLADPTFFTSRPAARAVFEAAQQQRRWPPEDLAPEPPP